MVFEEFVIIDWMKADYLEFYKLAIIPKMHKNSK